MKQAVDLHWMQGFRQKLHRAAELSGCEHQTSEIIASKLQEFSPDKLIKGIGGTGIAAVFSSGKPGPTVLLRADMDALPIQELNHFDYKSERKGIAHLCGHDGHSTILMGVAAILQQQAIKNGRVVLLFQPAEETGEGAHAVLNSPSFETIKPDYAFALHNLPGFPQGSIVVKSGVFAAASVGLSVNLKGRTAHASQPETGLSPAIALADLMQQFSHFNAQLDKNEHYSLLTLTHARLGERAFGTAPGEALLQATLRSFNDELLGQMQKDCIDFVTKVAQKNGLQYQMDWVEAFPATVNHQQCISILLSAVNNCGIQPIVLEKPFRWSEDFGHFGSIAPSCLFGLGAGEQHPDLHNPDYDFPDEITLQGVKVFNAIIREICS